MLDAYDKQEMTLSEIVDNFVFLFFAGIDTTSNFTGLCQYALAND